MALSSYWFLQRTMQQLDLVASNSFNSVVWARYKGISYIPGKTLLLLPKLVCIFVMMLTKKCMSCTPASAYGAHLYLADVLREAFLAESCSPSLSPSLLLSFKSSSSILKHSTHVIKAQFSLIYEEQWTWDQNCCQNEWQSRPRVKHLISNWLLVWFRCLSEVHSLNQALWWISASI